MFLFTHGSCSKEKKHFPEISEKILIIFSATRKKKTLLVEIMENIDLLVND